MKHVLDSEEAKEFFNKAGIKIHEDSAHNVLKLVSAHGELEIWAETYECLAFGVPGLFVDNQL